VFPSKCQQQQQQQPTQTGCETETALPLQEVVGLMQGRDMGT
jgi:hypothetical protein